MSSILIFPDLNTAAAAVAQINSTVGFTGSTATYALPQALVDGRFCIPSPTDPSWLAGVTGYTTASSIGMAPINEAAGPTFVPLSVTNFQARAVMMGMPSPTGTAGRTLFQDVDDALKAEAGVAYQAWEYANDVSRNGPLVGSLAAKFGFTSAQLDQVFISAAAITA